MRIAIGTGTVAAVFSALPAVVLLVTGGPSELFSLFMFLGFLADRPLAICLVALLLAPVLVIGGLLRARRTGRPLLFAVGIAIATAAVGFGLGRWPQIMPLIGWGGFGVLAVTGTTAAYLFFRQPIASDGERISEG